MIVYYSKHNSRNFHVTIDNIANYLQKHNNAILDNKQEQFVVYNGNSYKVLDCEILIYYPETDTYKGVSFADLHSSMISLFIDRNKKGDLCLSSQYTNTVLHNNIIEKRYDFNFVWKPSIYAPSYPHVSLDTFYIKRELKTGFIDKFAFRGTTHPEHSRTSTHILKNSEWFDGPEYTGVVEEYLDDIINYKVGLSVPGVGELCYRDVEYMAIGIPLMKFKYLTDLNPPLVPNFHYISIERPESENVFAYNSQKMEAERLGSLEYAEAYVKRFLEVKDDLAFLNFISKNARSYYKTYLHPSTNLKHVLDLLEINNSI